MKNTQINYAKIASIVAFFFICLNINAQWPQFRGPNRDGFSNEINLLKTWPTEGPELVWSSDTIGDGFSSAIIHDKIIYVSGRRDSSAIITAFDLNGKLIWQENIGISNNKFNWGESSTPTFYNGKLYTITIPGDVCCVDAKTGALEWKVNLPHKFGGQSSDYFIEDLFCESPLVVDGKVIVTPGGNNTTVVALNRTSGETIWVSKTISDRNSYVSPVLVQNKNKKLIVTRTKENVLAVDFYTGDIVYQKKVYTEGFVPLPNKNQVYFPHCMLLDIDTSFSSFNSLWQDTLSLNVWGGAVKVNDQIFATYETTSGIFSLDWETGKQVAFNKGIRGANLLAADGMIYSYEDKRGRVSLLKPTEDSIKIVGFFKVPLGEGANLAHMSIANGLLFVRHGKFLMAYDIKQTGSKSSKN